MADENGYTTIRIREDSRKKLEKIREGSNKTFSDIIEDLIAHFGGIVTDDVENIFRERVAFDLRYTDFNRDYAVREISFTELRNADVGKKFTAKVDPVAETFSNEEAELVWRDGDCVLLKITETVVEGDKRDKFFELRSVELF